MDIACGCNMMIEMFDFGIRISMGVGFNLNIIHRTTFVNVLSQ